MDIFFHFRGPFLLPCLAGVHISHGVRSKELSQLEEIWGTEYPRRMHCTHGGAVLRTIANHPLLGITRTFSVHFEGDADPLVLKKRV